MWRTSHVFRRAFKSRYERRGRTSDHNAVRHKESLPQHPPASEPSSPRRVARTACGVIETTLESLTTEDGVRRLFSDVDLDVSVRTWHVVGAGATNTRGSEKPRTVPLEYCRERIDRAASHLMSRTENLL